jgi:signal transduction histidine kinase
MGSLLLLSPYSNRLWTAEDQTYLSTVTPLLVPILERGQRAAKLKIDYDRTIQEAQTVMAQVAESQKKFAEKAAELEKRPAAAITTKQARVITSLSQELRTPIASIIGYTDLLLDESDGMLSPLQRKFIEHIKTSTEQIGGLADDLIQATSMESGKRKSKSELIDPNLIVDNAMAFTSAQIRAKDITLRLDITGTAPRVQTDRETLQQILIRLLQNATAVTPKEGNIILRLQMQDREDSHFLSIQVTDNGGGIAPADIPRVFERRHEPKDALIEGLGDSGTGLSIVKSLVEAQNGRISVETEAGVGSTFSVLIPVLVESPVENGQ